MSDDFVRRKLIQRAQSLKREIEQIFTDMEYWNNNVRKADEEPIDCDPDGQLKKMLQQLNAGLAREG